MSARRHFVRHILIKELMYVKTSNFEGCASNGARRLFADVQQCEVNKMAKKKAPAYPTFFVKSAVKEFAKQNDMMVGSDAYEAINEKIGMMLTAAAGRCKENKRKTLKAYDL